MTIYKKSFEILFALILSIAFILQVIIIFERADELSMTVLKSLGITLSYMTIWTNLLLFFTFWSLVWGKNKLIRHPFLSALLLYISIVGLIYHIALARLYHPQGYMYYTDFIYHTLAPLFYLAYWLIFEEKSPLQYSRIFRWLIYPVVYMLISLGVGLMTHFYPYPIFNFDTMQFWDVIRNVFFSYIAYVIVGIAIVSINNYMAKTNLKPNLDYQNS